MNKVVIAWVDHSRGLRSMIRITRVAFRGRPESNNDHDRSDG
jgi:hypothetical protein